MVRADLRMLTEANLLNLPARKSSRAEQLPCKPPSPQPARCRLLHMQGVELKKTGTSSNILLPGSKFEPGGLHGNICSMAPEV